MSRKLLTTSITGLLAVLVAVNVCAADKEGFEVQIKIENGHLGKAFFGCDNEATKQYDRGKDIMAPPPGRGTGYTVFFVKEHKLRLYKDFRPPKERNTWQFYARVPEDSPVRLSWTPKSLPEGRSFYVQTDNKGGKEKNQEKLNMRKTTSISIPETGTVTFIGAKGSDDTEDEKAKEETNNEEK